MKKQLLYIVIGSLATFGMMSCNSDDPSDASSKHDYSNGNYAPYLRTNSAATANVRVDFPVATLGQPQVIDLKDYAPYFHSNLGMTVDEVMAAMDAGKVVLHNILVAKGCWDLTEPNYGSTGWAYSANNEISSDNAAFTVDFNRNAHSFVLNTVGDQEAGVMASINVGFAIDNGKDFDDYVRFAFSLAVTDPSIIMARGSIPGDDYAAYSVEFANYEEEIAQNLGLTLKEFCNYFDAGDTYDADGNLDGDQIEVYLLNANGEWVTKDNFDGAPNGYAANGRPRTTSGWMGWWLDDNLQITSWDGAGYPANFLFLEGGDKCINIGRAPGVATGTEATVPFVFTLSWDHSKSLTFYVTVSLE